MFYSTKRARHLSPKTVWQGTRQYCWSFLWGLARCSSYGTGRCWFAGSAGATCTWEGGYNVSLPCMVGELTSGPTIRCWVYRMHSGKRRNSISFFQQVWVRLVNRLVNRLVIPNSLKVWRSIVSSHRTPRKCEINRRVNRQPEPPESVRSIASSYRNPRKCENVSPIVSSNRNLQSRYKLIIGPTLFAEACNRMQYHMLKERSPS